MRTGSVGKDEYHAVAARAAANEGSRRPAISSEQRASDESPAPTTSTFGGYPEIHWHWDHLVVDPERPGPGTDIPPGRVARRQLQERDRTMSWKESSMLWT